jgi:hypothetical protein
VVVLRVSLGYFSSFTINHYWLINTDYQHFRYILQSAELLYDGNFSRYGLENLLISFETDVLEKLAIEAESVNLAWLG